jgi:hypothetical protein
MKLRKRLISILTFLAALLAVSSGASAKVSVEKAEKIQPPALVECKDAATCDRSSEHLEAFVAGFYKWNEANNIVFFSFPRKFSAEARSEHVRARNQDIIMRKMLTSEFYHWTTTYTSDQEPEPKPQYCPSGTNVITCSQDAFDEWLNATAQLIEMDGDRALIVASRLFRPNGGRSYFAVRLSVRLRVERGAWRIDSICCPETISLSSEQ